MEYGLILGIYAVATVLITIFVNRKLILIVVSQQNQIGIFLRTIKNKKLQDKIRPQIKDSDRRLWVFLSKCLDGWEELVKFVQPKTVTDWDKNRFARFWRKKCQAPRRKVGRPPITEKHIEFIRRISEQGLDSLADKIVIILGIDQPIGNAGGVFNGFAIDGFGALEFLFGLPAFGHIAVAPHPSHDFLPDPLGHGIALEYFSVYDLQDIETLAIRPIGQ